jgi:hypothetical protein
VKVSASEKSSSREKTSARGQAQRTFEQRDEARRLAEQSGVEVGRREGKHVRHGGGLVMQKETPASCSLGGCGCSSSALGGGAVAILSLVLLLLHRLCRETETPPHFVGTVVSDTRQASKQRSIRWKLRERISLASGRNPSQEPELSP